MGNAAEDYGDDTNHFTTSPQQADLDIGASRGYPFDQFAIAIHQACLNQRSVGNLESEKKDAEAGTCGRSLITRRSLVRVQPPLPQAKTEAFEPRF